VHDRAVGHMQASSGTTRSGWSITVPADSYVHRAQHRPVNDLPCFRESQEFWTKLPWYRRQDPRPAWICGYPSRTGRY